VSTRPSTGLRTLALVTSLVAAGCRDATGSTAALPENRDLSHDLPVVAPADVGLDAAKLDVAYTMARLQPNMASLLVVRNGYLAREEYFAGRADSTLAPVHGMTTSVVSVLAGIAVQQGLVESIDQSIADYLVPDVVPSLDQSHRAITLRHLLTMTSGIEWDEGAPVASDVVEGEALDGLWEQALSQPVVDVPGSRVNYNSGAASLLSVILSRATGMETLAWARQVLFDPLGIDSLGWGKDGSYTNGGSGLLMRPRDVARIGALYVSGGSSRGQSIVASDWIAQSLTPVVADGVPYRFGPIDAVSLGYLWWKDQQPTRDAFFGWGYGGQFLYCVPAEKLVVVTTTDVSGLEDYQRRDLEKALLDLILDRILPAVVQ